MYTSSIERFFHIWALRAFGSQKTLSVSMSNVFSFKNNGVFLGTQMCQDKFRRVLLKFEVVPMINSLPQKRQVLGGLARQISLPCWELTYPTGMEEEHHLDPATGNNRNMLVAWRVSPKPACFGDFGDTSLTIFTIHHHARGDQLRSR